MTTSAENPPPAPPTPPDDPEELRGFPQFVVASPGQVWRTHKAGFGPWYFSDSGRFGLKYPNGTCYLAMDPLTAISETAVRGQRVLQESDLRRWVIRQMPTPASFDLADLMDRKAGGFGVTRDICSGDDYDTPRAWGRAFLAISYGGIRYWARHDSGATAAAYAVFGRFGERKSWRRGRGESLAHPKWVERIRSEIGISILPDTADDADFLFVDKIPT